MMRSTSAVMWGAFALFPSPAPAKKPKFPCLDQVSAPGNVRRLPRTVLGRLFDEDGIRVLIPRAWRW